MQAGHLEVEDGIADERRRLRLPRVNHRLKRLVCIGNDGFVTLAALRWLSDVGASFVMLDRLGKVRVVTGPASPSEARLRRAQALALENGTAVKIARELISAKLSGQEVLVREKLNNVLAADLIVALRPRLDDAADLDAIRGIESRAAAEYWNAWRDLPILFPRKEATRTPAHWLTFGPRHSPLTGGPRLSVNPANSLLNYTNAVAESECRLAACASGLDPGLGVLHTDTANRDSLALDLIETIRPAIEAWILDWLMHEPLRRSDFIEAANGNCRLSSSLCSKLSETAPTWGRLVAPWAEYVARASWATTSQSKVPATRLTQQRRREAKGSSRLPPEIPTPRRDLFSFGAVLYEMVTGACPFRGESSGSIFDAILNRAPVAAVRLNPDLPIKLQDIIDKALEKDRNLRYQNAADMRTDLGQLKRDTESGRIAAVKEDEPPLRTGRATAAVSSGSVPVASSSGSTRTLEIAHVLFLDIVAYSRLPMEEQEQVLRELQDTVRQTSEFTRAQVSQQLISLPTGDGMALVFFGDAEAAVRCASELSRALRKQTGLELRMGIHTGPVYRVADINANRNVAGGGINIAQRVMDCGDAGHILLSSAVADVLRQVSTAWNNSVHDLGEAEVKHGVRVHLYNLYTEEVGNRELPQKLRTVQTTVATLRSKTKRRRITLKVAAAAVIAALATGGFLYWRRPEVLTEKDTIVLADFSNATGDAVFDDTLKQALAAGLEQSPFLNILSEGKVQQTLTLMNRPPEERLTSAIAREVCQRTGSKAMLAGSIARLGTQYVIGLSAVNCNSGDSLAQAQVQAAGKEGLLEAPDKLATKLRSKLGESLGSIQKFDTPVEEVTTPSLDALKAYSVGRRTEREKGGIEAMRFYERAIELDPDFALAYASLGVQYSNLGRADSAVKSLRKAFELRERVSEREKFRISAFYYSYATGELEKANQTYELWAQRYPRDDVPPGNLAQNYSWLGQYDKSLAESEEALRLAPDDVTGYANLAVGYLVLNRLDDAKATFEQALTRKLDGFAVHSNMYYLAFLRGDVADMERQFAWCMGKPGEDALLSAQSDTEAYYGRLGKAREFSWRAVESGADANETSALWRANGAVREAEFGNSAQARRAANAALAIAEGRDIKIMVVLALARAGDAVPAQKLCDELAKAYPANTILNFYWLPTMRASIEISRNNAPEAIELLRTVAPIELGWPQPFQSAGTLYPVYLRGEAYLATHQNKEAAAEFLKILDHRGIVLNFPLGALAYLGLGRAYAQSGDTAKARSAYDEFFKLWAHADPDIPILKQAKAEYARLQ